MTTLRLLKLTLFPYTTLFRSLKIWPPLCAWPLPKSLRTVMHPFAPLLTSLSATARTGRSARVRVVFYTGRSEEHTSELQSRGHIVCRLLLEKKTTYYWYRSNY